jgi:hypothetical protein
MYLEAPLPYFKDLVTCLWAEPDDSSPYSHILFL